MAFTNLPTFGMEVGHTVLAVEVDGEDRSKLPKYLH
jgi:hypothetical protein